MLSSGLKMNKDSQEENNPKQNKKFNTNARKSVRSDNEKPLGLKNREKDKHSKPRPPFKTNHNISPNLAKIVLANQALSSRENLAFPMESKLVQDNSMQNKAQDSLGSHPGQQSEGHPEQRWEGFPNLGNTCYMNAILQSLFAIPSFADDLLKPGLPLEDFCSEALIIPLSHLLILKDISKVETKGELLLSVKNAISAVSEIFSGNMQNDAHEFLSQCLYQLKEDIEYLNIISNSERERGDANLPPQMYAGNGATKVLICPVAANFEFETQTSIFCKGCGQVILKKEPNNYLSINLHQEALPLPMSIQRYFDNFFQPEEFEYNCNKCQHKSSILSCKFSRLPRVLIVHLKRYSFNSALLLVKNSQKVEISKYLTLSSHCNEDTEPPHPLYSNEPVGNDDVLNFSQEMISTKLISEPHDSLALHIEPDMGAELQKFQSIYEEVSLKNSSKLEPELDNSINRPLGEKRQPRADWAMDERPSFGIPDTGLTEAHFQEVPEYTELKNDEEMNVLGIWEHTDKELSTVTELRLEKTDLNFVDASGSDKNLENKSSSDGESTVDRAKGPKHVETEPIEAYRLISIVSHIGLSQDSGHYVSDTYDFRKQAWLTYNDMKVSEIPEAMIQKMRACTGYIFFYMHNEIFEALLQKAASSEVLGAQAAVVSQ